MNLGARLSELIDVDEGTLHALARLEPMTVPAGQVLFAPGDACQGLPILLDGLVQVWLSHSSGKEMLWYQIGAGDPCLASTSALLTGDTHNASARVARDTTLIVVPSQVVEQLMQSSPSFRSMILQGYVRRWQTALDRLYSVAFLGVDQQLAQVLLSAPGHVRLTHQQLADQLGTAREVITRTLRRFEDAGAVRLGRGDVEVIDRDWLHALVQPFASLP